MADKDDVVVAEPTNDDATDAQEEQVETPETMDEVIEKEAEAELDEERGEEKATEEAPEEEEPETEEVEDEPEEEPEEEVEEVEEEAEPIDKTSFRDVGLDAITDDYKPESWADFMRDMVDVVRGEVNKESQAISQQEQAFQEEVTKVDEGWQSEIEELQKSGDIPKGKDGESATTSVFEFMAENNEKYANEPNKQIWSFETAYKLMNANKVTDERAEEIKSRRKSRAAATASTGNSEGGKGIPQILKGETMDDIIARELNL